MDSSPIKSLDFSSILFLSLKFYYSYNTLQEKRLNTRKKVVAITANVIVIGVIGTTKKSMQVVVINSEVIYLFEVFKRRP